MGTPDYIAPEMALGGGNAGAASDLYGVGCVAYWLLRVSVFLKQAERWPMLAHVRETPSPLSEKAAHEVPAALEQIVMRCLEKNPADRYASADELERALAGVAIQESYGPANARGNGGCSTRRNQLWLRCPGRFDIHAAGDTIVFLSSCKDCPASTSRKCQDSRPVRTRRAGIVIRPL